MNVNTWKQFAVVFCCRSTDSKVTWQEVVAAWLFNKEEMRFTHQRVQTWSTCLVENQMRGRTHGSSSVRLPQTPPASLQGASHQLLRCCLWPLLPAFQGKRFQQALMPQHLNSCSAIHWTLSECSWTQPWGGGERVLPQALCLSPGEGGKAAPWICYFYIL